MDSSRFIVCRASAGSGKTYTLVKHYLELAFDGASESDWRMRFRQILAITFTNKAVNEMKSRILGYLKSIHEQGASEQMCRDLMASLGLAESEVRQRAGVVLGAILHSYSDFSVCTIDSFMHHVVRTFARDLELPVNFDVAIDVRKVIEDSVDTLMGQVGGDADEGLSELLGKFAESKMMEGKSFQVDVAIRALAERLFDEDAADHLDKIRHIGTQEFIDLYGQYAAENRAVTVRLRQIGEEAVRCYTEQGFTEADFFQKAKGLPGFFRKVAAGEFVDPNSYVRQFMESGKMTSDTKKVVAMAALEAPLRGFVDAAMALKEQEEPLYNTRQMVMGGLYALALMNRLNAIVQAYYQEEELLHISEFNKRINEVVQNEPVPFIYERIGSRYTNFLIDEFQDTSRMQWLNLVPLVAGGVSSGHASLVVGDGKQAIYRFRQGDVRQFTALPQVEGSADSVALEAAHEPLDLDFNYRTGATIVDFNNRFFAWAAANRFGGNVEIGDCYLRGKGGTELPGLYQHPQKEGGYVEVGFYEKESLWERMVAAVRSQVAKGYRYADIVVLARNKKILMAFSRYVTEHAPEVSLVSSESFLIGSSRVVMLLRAVLGYVVRPASREAQGLVLWHIEALDGRFTGSMDRMTDRAVTLEMLLQEHGMTLPCDRLAAMDLYDCCEAVVRLLGDTIAGKETAYVASFLNVVAKYGRRNRQNLREFLDWFDDEVAHDHLSASTADDMDAVRLMTIHAAKGLESKIVLLPLLKEKEHGVSLWVDLEEAQGGGLPTSYVRFSAKKASVFDRQFQEELRKQELDDFNILYVAMTRPKHKIMLFCEAWQNEADKERCDARMMLLDFLRSDGIAPAGEEKLCSFGVDGAVQEDNGGRRQSVEHVEMLSFPPWEERVMVAVTGGPTEERLRWGIQVHELLSAIGNRQQAAEALRRYAERNGLADAEAHRLRRIVDSVLSDAVAGRFFDPAYEVKNEGAFYYNNKEYRADRVVIAPEATYVVDFKTGRRRQEDLEQVRNYCAAIDDMQAYPKAEGFLIYLSAEGCEVQPVAQ